MTVYFIGAGPGDPDLITVKGARLVEECPVVVYAGSLVPRAVIDRARPDAKVYNSADMDLDDLTRVYQNAHEKGEHVARVQTGDLSIYSSLAEQTRRLNELGIDWKVVPGVSSFQASAAALGQELTLPEKCQTIILSRASGRTPVPEKENLRSLASHEATLCLFLSATLIRKVVRELSDVYPPDWPVAVVEKASHPEQRIFRGTLSTIAQIMHDEGIRSTAMIIVSKVLGDNSFVDSKLYDPTFSHTCRQARIVANESE
ncbi:Precorrin-4 C(11)-methyltransferase [Vibrio nigripulchritudo SO65]|uniref:precorrin-4 C(11)-methyltransferase n=1 Tax=Vibrio nigripulchritudo TaxID=28173 RepID=UPI0003B1EB9D|nr:precorrin-4 C(11)-methyltransferase [Vibrio nigripulchritudo]CCN38360.1 Precorrin-4 C(11)-methyltransferase [Vibrio nigripulchritudo AM115]CCN44660.1 Precorrin-4 C(11)-methyltransferase [Vibrio nigripulchritudo FTn2]CCN62942.1 Precorrin-4 C(11)-methyltransferase [Vibrio nigripulchritudo POn4]CCN79643.1 Precorrin-4 C(11)-methyltransferase [Vibrio nigripulchritudo SO65]